MKKCIMLIPPGRSGAHGGEVYALNGPLSRRVKRAVLRHGRAVTNADMRARLVALGADSAVDDGVTHGGGRRRFRAAAGAAASPAGSSSSDDGWRGGCGHSAGGGPTAGKGSGCPQRRLLDRVDGSALPPRPAGRHAAPVSRWTPTTTMALVPGPWSGELATPGQERLLWRRWSRTNPYTMNRQKRDAHHPAPRGIAEGTEDRHEDHEDEGEQERDEQNRHGPLAHPGAGLLGTGTPASASGPGVPEAAAGADARGRDGVDGADAGRRRAAGTPSGLHTSAPACRTMTGLPCQAARGRGESSGYAPSCPRDGGKDGWGRIRLP